MRTCTFKHSEVPQRAENGLSVEVEVEVDVDELAVDEARDVGRHVQPVVRLVPCADGIDVVGDGDSVAMSRTATAAGLGSS